MEYVCACVCVCVCVCKYVHVFLSVRMYMPMCISVYFIQVYYMHRYFCMCAYAAGSMCNHMFVYVNICVRFVCICTRFMCKCIEDAYKCVYSHFCVHYVYMSQYLPLLLPYKMLLFLPYIRHYVYLCMSLLLKYISSQSFLICHCVYICKSLLFDLHRYYHMCQYVYCMFQYVYHVFNSILWRNVILHIANSHICVIIFYYKIHCVIVGTQRSGQI